MVVFILSCFELSVAIGIAMLTALNLWLIFAVVFISCSQLMFLEHSSRIIILFDYLNLPGNQV